MLVSVHCKHTIVNTTSLFAKDHRQGQTKEQDRIDDDRGGRAVTSVFVLAAPRL